MLWQMQQYWRRQRARRHWMIFVAGLLVLTIGLSLMNGLGRVDRLLADLSARLDGRRVSSDIVIVAIDDDSIAEFAKSAGLGFGRWPWPRQTHAVLLSRLHEAGAKVVGLDIFMPEEERMDPLADTVLASSIRQNNPVVLPISTYQPAGGDGWIEVLKPAGELADSAEQLAHINLIPDPDGIARSINLREGRDGAAGGIWNHMALAMWELGQQKKGQQYLIPGVRASRSVIDAIKKLESEGPDGHVIGREWLQDYHMLIPYAGPPGSYQRYSYIDVYEGKVGAEQLSGKYVLVGGTALGLGDTFATPMSSTDALMPGVEIIANVLDGLLQNVHRYPAPLWGNVIFNLIPVLLAIPLFYLGQPRTVLSGIVLLMLLDLICMWLLRRFASVQVLPAASLVCLMLAYPLWSWRRLELAMQQIMAEFSRMRRENGFFRDPQHVYGDRLERNLQAFESAAWQLRELQQMVRQSLDELPYVMLVTDASGQVILSNTEARRLFRVNPPLPTMAFEPALGGEEFFGDTEVQAHHLSALLSSHFLRSLLQQYEQSAYAKALIDFMAEDSSVLQAGWVEVNDGKTGAPYLLKIVPRVMTIERSQGWLVTLVNLSGGQRSEIQRDQVLRYLQENVCEQLIGLEKNTESHRCEKWVRQSLADLVMQVRGFLDFEYAQTSIYISEKLDLSDLLLHELARVCAEQDLPWDLSQIPLTESLMMKGDPQILSKALHTVVSLLVRISGGGKMPVIKVKQRQDFGAAQKMVRHKQVYLIFPVTDIPAYEQKKHIFKQPVPQETLPAEIEPETLQWWAVNVTMTRHAGTVRVEQTERSIGVMIEFMV